MQINVCVCFWVAGWPQRRKRRLRRSSSRRGWAQLIEWGVLARQEDRGHPHCSCSPRRTPSVDIRALLLNGHILFHTIIIIKSFPSLYFLMYHQFVTYIRWKCKVCKRFCKTMSIFELEP